MEICDFGFEMQDLSDFKISSRVIPNLAKYVIALYEEGNGNGPFFHSSVDYFFSSL